MSPAEIKKFPDPGLFGDCPKCGRNDGYLNLYKAHWFICKRHKLKWYVGYDLFPSWRDETEADWQRNRELLSRYEEVRPRFRTLRDNLRRSVSTSPK